MNGSTAFEIAFVLALVHLFTNSYENPTLTHSCRFMSSCKCVKQQHSRGLKVDCSGIGLTKIPRFPDIVEELELNRNNITDIADGWFINNSRLQVLDLSDNRVRLLRKSSFKGLENLLLLNLNNNDLSSGNQSFINNPFRYLRSLTTLNLKNNFADQYQPDLSALLSLKFLSIDFISYSTGILSPHFAVLNLTNLDLSGLSGNCSIKQLDSNSFQNLLQIKNLNISCCKIQSIFKFTFNHLKMIESLDISNNTCLKFEVLKNVTFDLQFSKIKILKFNKIHKTFDLTTLLQREHFIHLTNTSLREIYSDSNRLQLIEKDTLTYLPKTMEHVSIKDNMLTAGPYIIDVFSMTITTLDVSGLNSFHIDDNDNSEQCTSVITCINSSILHNYRVDNEIQPLSTIPFIPIPRNLRTLNVRSSHIALSMSKINFLDNNLEHIDASNNIITSISGKVMHLTSLKYLDLSSNMCTYLSADLFSTDFLNLEHLHLQNNLLGLVFPHDQKGNTFHNLYKLQTLNLSSNEISKLPFNFFKSQKNLTTLDLSNNILEGIYFNIIQMKNLTSLNLTNNRITFLGNKARTQLENIAEYNKAFELELSDNPLLCTCETIEFVKWMAFTHVRMKKKTNYKCQLSNLALTNFKNPDAMYRQLQKNCMTFKPLIVVLASAITLFLFIVCTGLVYRYRWKLRYLYYMVKIRSHKPMSSLDDNDHSEYMYDAFVSYADEDRIIVHKKLLTKLETENGIKLCIHKRNFLPGNDIATNITSAIHNSRKTIAILSHNFLRSHWCLFEYNMARMESIYERNNENILFLIFIEQVTANDLPLHILELVHSQSYIEYPNDEYGDEVFWNQIIRALNE